MQGMGLSLTWNPNAWLSAIFTGSSRQLYTEYINIFCSDDDDNLMLRQKVALDSTIDVSHSGAELCPA